MTKCEDFLVEIHTEELPPKTLLKLAEAFQSQIVERIQKAELSFDRCDVYAAPRRLAVCVKNLASSQPDQTVERKGPAINAAFDAHGKPTPACVGFARSCGVTPQELLTIKNHQGEWVGYQQHVPGKSVAELMPAIVEQSAMALPISKRMRWGNGDVQFVRPVHSVILMYGDQVIPATILGCVTGRKTRGHRFHSPGWLTISRVSDYNDLLMKNHVMADFANRRAAIQNDANKVCAHEGMPVLSNELLDEVAGLVEWPIAIYGYFDDAFLQLPEEVLISSMQDHQRYFPVKDSQGKLLPAFVAISNIDSKDPERVRHGNERVLRARLADAAFFFATDKHESLQQRVERLKGIVFQAKLGTLYDKAERISHIASFIASKIGASVELSARAGLLAKADLTTNMVNEFPELQGVMGGYYANHDGEADDVAQAIREQYMPRFAGDKLPGSLIGQVVAIADRIDTLVGTFGMNQIPTGEKDPFGLRRAAVGILRILIEDEIDLDLREVLDVAVSCYKAKLENKDVVAQILNFMQERLRFWYLEQEISADVFAAVAALSITNPLDVHQRVKAVQAFKNLSEAETLSVANKRVSNILSKYVDVLDAKKIDPEYFENAAETELARQLEVKSQLVKDLYQSGKYDQVLLQLAELRQPIDDFFDTAMVMTDDKQRRENRILLLSKLRALFLQVADIALLQ